MIRITMKRYNQTVELELPTDYEHVLVCLWKLGLKRDAEKYTLRDLNAVFHYDTPTEHQMIRLIDSNNTLMLALRSLHEMIAPPHPVAEVLREKLAEGCYNTANDYYMDLEQLAYDRPAYHTTFLFPISGELVDKQGHVKKAPWDLMLSYERMIDEAVMNLQFQALYWESELFSDVEGAYQKIMVAGWSVINIEDMLYGHVFVSHTEPFTRDEMTNIVEKIEMINSTELAIRLKQWSVLTDEGLLFIYLCDEHGDYSLIDNGDTEEEEDDEEAPCLCPECQERLRKQAGAAGAVLSKEELEDGEDEC